jgi:hypothetical protein
MQQQNLVDTIIWLQKQNGMILNQTTLHYTTKKAEFCTSFMFTDRHDNKKRVRMTIIIEMKNQHSLSVSDNLTSMCKKRKRMLNRL